MGTYIMILIVLAFYALLGIVSFGVATLGIQKILLLSEELFEKKYKNLFINLLKAFAYCIPFTLYLFFVLSRDDLNYNLILTLFILSSFIGFIVFVLFVKSILKKKPLEGIISFLLGAGVALIFLPSGYFTFKPMVEYVYVKNDGIIFGSLEYLFFRDSDYEDKNTTALFNKNDSAGERELKVRRHNLEKNSYNYFLNMPPSPEVRDVKLNDFFEDFLTTASKYSFSYKATPKYFEFLATHDKYPKKDPKNVPVHKVSCSDYRAAKEGDECYFGVLYPYFHNIIYTPMTEEVKHNVGYYVW